MSGGFVCRHGAGKVAAALGIICADNSETDASRDYTRRGETVAFTWGALSLRMPLRVPSPEGGPSYTLHQMIPDGYLPMPAGEIDHIEALELGDGSCRISIAQPRGA